mmetsp:Transcript_19012/g.42780  ORF Transcript_19012/g.42780 Transcript_19012/m.42780 type:complete len:248 (-) Transcript_19012:526-1269(-)
MSKARSNSALGPAASAAIGGGSQVPAKAPPSSSSSSSAPASRREASSSPAPWSTGTPAAPNIGADAAVPSKVPSSASSTSVPARSRLSKSSPKSSWRLTMAEASCASCVKRSCKASAADGGSSSSAASAVCGREASAAAASASKLLKPTSTCSSKNRASPEAASQSPLPPASLSTICLARLSGAFSGSSVRGRPVGTSALAASAAKGAVRVKTLSVASGGAVSCTACNSNCCNCSGLGPRMGAEMAC